MKTNKILLLLAAIAITAIVSCQKTIPDTPTDEQRAEWAKHLEYVESFLDENHRPLRDGIVLEADNETPAVGERFRIDASQHYKKGGTDPIGIFDITWEILSGPVIRTNINEFMFVDDKPCTILASWNYKDTVFASTIELDPLEGDDVLYKHMIVDVDTYTPTVNEPFRITIYDTTDNEINDASDCIQYLLDGPIVQTNISEFICNDKGECKVTVVMFKDNNYYFKNLTLTSN